MLTLVHQEPGTTAQNLKFNHPKTQPTKQIHTQPNIPQTMTNVRTITTKIQTLWPIASSDEISKQLGVREGVLKAWRESKIITQGIHWYYRPGTTNRILWNLDLMRDFVACGNQNHPGHKAAIERYLASLPSSVST